MWKKLAQPKFGCWPSFGLFPNTRFLRSLRDFGTNQSPTAVTGTKRHRPVQHRYRPVQNSTRWALLNYLSNNVKNYIPKVLIYSTKIVPDTNAYLLRSICIPPPAYQLSTGDLCFERAQAVYTTKKLLDDNGKQPDGMRMERKRKRMKKERVPVKNDIFTVIIKNIYAKINLNW